jgi:hypothetical protein
MRIRPDKPVWGFREPTIALQFFERISHKSALLSRLLELAKRDQRG